MRVKGYQTQQRYYPGYATGQPRSSNKVDQAKHEKEAVFRRRRWLIEDRHLKMKGLPSE